VKVCFNSDYSVGTNFICFSLFCSKEGCCRGCHSRPETQEKKAKIQYS